MTVVAIDKFQIQFSKLAHKDLKKLSHPVQRKLIKHILLLEHPFQTPQVRALVNHSSATHRLRVGDYRVLYDTYSDTKVILIIRIGHRKDIYR